MRKTNIVGVHSEHDVERETDECYSKVVAAAGHVNKHDMNKILRLLLGASAVLLVTTNHCCPSCFFGKNSRGTMKTRMTILLLCVEVTIVLGFSGQTDYASRLPGTKRSFRLLMLSLFPQNPVKVVGDWMERCTAAKHEVALTNSAVFFDFSNRRKKGVVMRTAARNFNSKGSNTPSSRNYTTRKIPNLVSR